MSKERLEKLRVSVWIRLAMQAVLSAFFFLHATQTTTNVIEKTKDRGFRGFARIRKLTFVVFIRAYQRNPRFVFPFATSKIRAARAGFSAYALRDALDEAWLASWLPPETIFHAATARAAPNGGATM